jgi:hypothetical protein
MSDLPNALAFNRRWWWDPPPPEILRLFEEEIQRQLVTISLETQATILRTHAEAFTKMAGIVNKQKQR